MAIINHIHSGTLERQISQRELAHSVFARNAAAEGFVLLKNEGVLPLADAAPIALFGGGAVKTIKGGTGSGDVNNRESVSIYQGLLDMGANLTSEDWAEDYGKRYEAARHIWKEKILEDVKHVENPFDAYAANPFSLPDGRKIKRKDIEGASVAVYVISRISGEGKDRRKEKGDYYLSEKEKEDILYLNQADLPVVLILNTGAPVELTDILQEAENIKAVLNISLPGQEAGHAVADVLFGRAVPGGRLTATWAKRYEDYPSADSYGYLNGNLETEEYKEGIYVGYRYFDSFGIEPLFPFGYGLSYTTFAIEFEDLQMTETGMELTVSVKNTGKYYAAREVAQVYISLPQKGDAKEYRRLAGFAKTEVLQPGQTQRLTVAVEQKSLASYSEQMHAWIIEDGKHGIWIGSHLGDLELVAVVEAGKRMIIERTKAICRKTAAFDELGAAEFAEKEFPKRMERAGMQRIPCFAMPFQKEREKIPPASQASLTKEQPTEELIPLLYGNMTQGASTLGSAGIRVPGSAGETTEALEEKYGIRSLIMADGPAGLRLRQSYEADRSTGGVYGTGVLGALENGCLDELEKHENTDIYYQYCTAFPVGTALAQSWDIGLMRKFGEAVAVEMEEFHVDLWLAPGMNIQRNPLCGRNFEYYSEDPLLSGILASAVTDGVQSSKKCGVTIKHFACNNQEDNRMNVDVRLSERVLREIYLRGFEIAVKNSRPMAIMSAYNRINGIHAANNKDICMTAAREEWGFEGVIMSDWNTTALEGGSVPWKCVEAGNDIIMPGNPDDEKNIREAYKQGKISEEMIRNSAGRILGMIRKLTG